MRSLTVASVLVCAPSLLASAQSPNGTASVSGKVSYEGTVPPPVKMQVSSDAACQALHPQGLERRAIAVTDGGLANALVYVKSGVTGAYPPPQEPVVLDQQGCEYVPSVIALQVGQPLKIRNSDGTFHNVHGFPAANGAFNIAHPRKGMEATRTFERAELLFPVRCDMHPWMLAFVAVLPHPFHAVSGPDGAFEIRGLPAGSYEIEALHDKLAPVTAKVNLGDGATAQLNLSLKE